MLIHLHPDDQVGIAKLDISPGSEIRSPLGKRLTAQGPIPAGHKVALVDLRRGDAIYRYGREIGRASADIPAGSWVHDHNLSLQINPRHYQYSVVEPARPAPSGRTFMGYARPDGRVGTRNTIAVISTVSCSTHVVSQIARAFPRERLSAYPNVDGVLPIIHFSGCSMPPGGRSQTYLKRTLGNLAKNPNIAAAIYVGLGCEVNQADDCQPLYTENELPLLAPHNLIIQDQGGFRRTVDAAIARIEDMLPRINAIQRTPQPLSALTLALQCGGSDGWSGISANPLVGRVVDYLVSEGGTAALAETPEIFGAEHLLTGRVTSAALGEKLIGQFEWWLAEAKLRGFTVDNNPTPGNKKGGLTTIFEKSLGAVAKGGGTPLNGVYGYSERIDRPGLVFMDTPGNDPISVTGQVAGGCNLILFTTGRGSVFGSPVSPCIKIASHTGLFERMGEDMDFNAGQVLDGLSWEAATEALFDQVVAVASGQRTASERNGLPESEFIPWQPDAFL